ncbi:MAG: 6,7-dimethyl-8-ribityllumazine synthase [Elusimicrobia bacterium]|nr:6,7-dimethyl-8-ribityllumazine synthase [Elusimicrobiota bacterium]
MKPRVAVVVSRFNEKVTSRLLGSCLTTLNSHGVAQSRIAVVRVSGGYEIPWAAQELALSGKFDAVIALGCILKGSTPQNEHISRSVIASLHEVSLKTKVPCILGVITPNTEAQALARTKGSLDRGKEAALAALEMIVVRKQLRQHSQKRIQEQPKEKPQNRPPRRGGR